MLSCRYAVATVFDLKDFHTLRILYVICFSAIKAEQQVEHAFNQFFDVVKPLKANVPGWLTAPFAVQHGRHILLGGAMGRVYAASLCPAPSRSCVLHI